MDRLDRRAVLAGAAALLAGCGAPPSEEGDGTAAATGRDGGPPATTGDDGRTQATTGDDGGTPATTGEDSGTPGETEGLDLREANVTGVAVEGGDGEYRFDVTLYHDDDGEDGYANWWQVERLDGERLGRRDLAHAHGTREFTRSTTVAVGDADCVVVRGHDRTHGYGGRVMVVAPATGATRAVRQGSDPDSFERTDCP